EDYYLKPSKSGGVFIDRGRNIIFGNNILEGSEYGDEQEGGSLIIKNSSEINVNNNQIKNPRFHGIQITDSRGIMITDCMITETLKPSRMVTGISLYGQCPETVVRGNNVSTGNKGAIVNNANGVILESNLFTKQISVND